MGSGLRPPIPVNIQSSARRMNTHPTKTVLEAHIGGIRLDPCTLEGES